MDNIFSTQVFSKQVVAQPTSNFKLFTTSCYNIF